MIYRLPVNGRKDSAYRGQYPERIAMVMGARGCYHVELNSGVRYVFTARDVPSGTMPRVGAEFRSVFDCSPHQVAEMDLVTYIGLVALQRIIRQLRSARHAAR